MERLLVLRGEPGGRAHQRLAGPAGGARAARSHAGSRRSAAIRSASRRAAPDVSVELKDTQPPLALKLKEILVVSQIWDPKLFIAEFTGPLTAADPGQPPHTTATWTLAQASVRGTPDKAGPRLDRGRRSEARPDSPGTPLFDAKHAEFHARVQFGSWPHNPAIDLATNLEDRERAGLEPLRARCAGRRSDRSAAWREGFRREADADLVARLAGGGRPV